MNSYVVPVEMDHLVKRCRLFWLIAASVLVYLVEGSASLPLPWFRLGLSNIFIMLAGRRMGFTAALQVGLGRILIGGLVSTQVFTPIFLINLGGAIGSTMIMALFSRISIVGFVGVSSLAAVTHVIGQIGVAMIILGDYRAIMGLAPILAGLALLSGPFTGVLAELVDRRIINHQPSEPCGQSS